MSNLSVRLRSPTIALVLVAMLVGLVLPATPARAEATASITGTVTSSKTGLPIEGITIEVRAASDWTTRLLTSSAADGTFSFTGLAPGSYYFYTSSTAYVGNALGPYSLVAGDNLVVNPVESKRLETFSVRPTPIIIGKPRVDVELVAEPGVWSPQPDELWYEWWDDDGRIPGATSNTYVPTTAQVGKVLRVVVTAIREETVSWQTWSDFSTPVLPAAVLAPSPGISGSRSVGQTLMVVPGTWSPAGTTLTYQWYRGAQPIAGATGASYVLKAADLGYTVTATVTGSYGTYAPVVRAARQFFSTAPGAFSMFAPVVSTTAAVGVPITVTLPSPISPVPASTTYSWALDGSAIAGAAGPTYTPLAADLGRELTVRVTAAAPGFDPLTVEASAGVTALGTFSVGSPTIAAARVGSAVTASPGVWTPAPTAFNYQWSRSGAAIAGATGSSYTPLASDLGATLTVLVTAARNGYSPSTRESAPALVAPGTLISTVKPGLSGSPVVGGTLVATSGSWSPLPGGLAYQWSVGGVPVPGSTGTTFPVRPDHVDSTISVTITATKPGFTSASVTANFATITGRAYANCAALNADYPHGVMRPNAMDLRSGTYHPPYAGTFVSQALYNLNAAGRDADKDGIACEKQ